MPTETINVGIEKITTGQESKEVAINVALDLIDKLLGGALSKSVAGSSNVLLTEAEATNAFYVFSGVLTGNIQVQWPSSGGKARLLRVYNNTTGAFTLTLVVQGGSGVAITQGQIRDFVIDGTTVRPTDVTAGTYTQASATATWARVFHNAAQSITSGTPTALAFNSERGDTDTIHDNVTNNSRLTATSAGLYLISVNLEWAANATGYREVFIRVSGATRIADLVMYPVQGGVISQQSLTTAYPLTAGQYVEAVVNQTSGGALNVNSASNYTPEFSMVRLGGA